MLSTPDRHVISISELNSQAKEVLELLSFWVEGEVTGFKPQDSQRYFYAYFTLQDTKVKASMSCAMRKDAFAALNLSIENGQHILVQGKMSLMTQSGRAVFLANTIEIAGQGKIAAEIEKLKRTLQAEGLLSEERKRPLPKLPQRIGVVTSVHSDAWEDFKRHSIAKFPHIELLVADSFVQGAKAPTSLVSAIETMQLQDIDILVVTRGGGSAEDLAAFNDERVVRAIASSRVPTVVGVGHEKDVSVADLVADVRASTPTNAGQIVTSYYEQVSLQLQEYSTDFLTISQRLLERYFQRLDETAAGLQRTNTKYQALPHHLNGIAASLARFQYLLVASNTTLLKTLDFQLASSGNRLIESQRLHLAGVKRQLEAVSPINVLSRGYSIARVGGKIVRTYKDVKPGDTLDIRLAQGSIVGSALEINSEE